MRFSLSTIMSTLSTTIYLYVPLCEIVEAALKTSFIGKLVSLILFGCSDVYLYELSTRPLKLNAVSNVV